MRMSVCQCTMYMQYQWRIEECIGSPGTEVTDYCEPPYACWDLNPVLGRTVLSKLSHLSSSLKMGSCSVVHPGLNPLDPNVPSFQSSVSLRL